MVSEACCILNGMLATFDFHNKTIFSASGSMSLVEAPSETEARAVSTYTTSLILSQHSFPEELSELVNCWSRFVPLGLGATWSPRWEGRLVLAN